MGFTSVDQQPLDISRIARCKQWDQLSGLITGQPELQPAVSLRRRKMTTHSVHRLVTSATRIRKKPKPVLTNVIKKIISHKSMDPMCTPSQFKIGSRKTSRGGVLKPIPPSPTPTPSTCNPTLTCYQFK